MMELSSVVGFPQAPPAPDASITAASTPAQADYSGQGIFVGSRGGVANFSNTNIRKVQFLQGLRTQAELNALTA